MSPKMSEMSLDKMLIHQVSLKQRQKTAKIEVSLPKEIDRAIELGNLLEISFKSCPNRYQC